MSKRRFRIAVDIGGTFTDCVALEDGGGTLTTKALTTPGDPAEGVVRCVAQSAAALGIEVGALLRGDGRLRPRHHHRHQHARAAPRRAHRPADDPRPRADHHHPARAAERSPASPSARRSTSRTSTRPIRRSCRRRTSAA